MMHIASRKLLSGALPVLALALSGPALAAEMGGEHGQMGSMGSMGHADEHGETFAFGMPGHADDATRTIHIDMMDNAYSLSGLNVYQGETVRFEISNGDDFTHEFVLGTADMLADHRKEMQEMMDSGMDMNTMMHHDPNAVTIPGGATKEFVWTFGQPGHYEFACNIPGHYEAGMHGTLDILSNN